MSVPCPRRFPTHDLNHNNNRISFKEVVKEFDYDYEYDYDHYLRFAMAS